MMLFHWPRLLFCGPYYTVQYYYQMLLYSVAYREGHCGGHLETVAMETGNRKWKWNVKSLYKCTLE